MRVAHFVSTGSMTSFLNIVSISVFSNSRPVSPVLYRGQSTGRVSLDGMLMQYFCNAYATEMTISRRFKFGQHIHKCVAVYVELASIIASSCCECSTLRLMSSFSTVMWRSMWVCQSAYSFSPQSFHQQAVRTDSRSPFWTNMHSGGSVPITVHVCLCSTTGFSEKLVINIRSGTFVWISYIAIAGNIRCVSLGACICSLS